MNVPNLPHKALDVLRRRGWIQRHAETDRGVCLGRACQIALSDETHQVFLVESQFRVNQWFDDILRRAVFTATNGEHNDIICFNDERGRTFAEIEKVLIAAGETWDLEFPTTEGEG